MKGISKEGIKAWNDRSDEIIRCDRSPSAEEVERTRLDSPLLTKNDLEQIRHEYRS